jgi:prevent-host-death family protein
VRSVSKKDFKDHLSRYLSEARNGEASEIRDRNKPIARLVPVSDEAIMDEEERALVAAGKLKPREQLLPDSFFSMPGPDISIEKAVAAVVADRDED